MRSPEEYEAEIDRLSAALDLEAKARQSMADMAFDLSVELREAKLKAEAKEAFYEAQASFYRDYITSLRKALYGE